MTTVEAREQVQSHVYLNQVNIQLQIFVVRRGVSNYGLDV